MRLLLRRDCHKVKILVDGLLEIVFGVPWILGLKMAHAGTHAHDTHTRGSIVRGWHKGESLKRVYCCTMAASNYRAF